MNTALSGLQASRKAFEGHAENIANLNTEGYRPVEAVFEEKPGGGVNVRLQRGETPPEGQSGTDLEAEVARAAATKIAYRSNLSVIRRYDEMVGSLLDIVG